MPDLSASSMSALPGGALRHVADLAAGTACLGQDHGTPTLVLYRAAPAVGLLEAPAIRQDRDVSDGAATLSTRGYGGVVLDEELFRSALSRERRRADRFDDYFALGTIVVDEARAGAIASALNGASRETDIVGWLEEGRRLGIILTGIPHATAEITSLIESRLERELALHVEPEGADSLEICWYVHAGPRVDGSAGLSHADPLLADLQSAERRRTVLDRFKRALDVLGSLALMLLLAPVFLLVAAVVKLTSPGPILFRQTRIGELARPFTMLKFRTMHVNNDPGLHQQFVTQFIKSSNREHQPGADTIFKIQRDPRLTPIGHFLRRTSLDELPQLWNVCRGDMSLVGPRPPLCYELEQYRPWHWRRVLEGKPGVTGLWQVAGRSRTTFDEMVRLDLHYVRTRNLWTDVRILLATPRAVVSGRGAC